MTNAQCGTWYPSAGLQVRYAADENRLCNLYVRHAFVVSDPYIDHENIQSILVRDVHSDGQHIGPYVLCKASGTFVNFLINGS